MRVTIAAMAVFGVLLTVAAGLAGAQQERWDARDLPVDGGREFRLRNGEGAAIILQCLQQAVGAGFEFTEPTELTTQRVTVRGVPGQQRNIAVQAVTDRVFRVASGPGRDFLLRTLSGSARILVRASGQREWFQVFGSETIVSQCYLQQDNDLSVPSLTMPLQRRAPLVRNSQFHPCAGPAPPGGELR